MSIRARPFAQGPALRAPTPPGCQSGPAMTEIACDESGHEGERLVGGETDVFAHASVRMGPAAAADLVAELRDRIRSPAQEYKANHLLRAKHRPVLDWFLGPGSPIHGEASVLLVDKSFFLLVRAIGEDAAREVYEPGRRTSEGWLPALAVVNDLLRGRADEQQVGHAVEAMGAALAALRTARVPPRDGGPPVLDLLVPAITRAVQRWSGDGPVVIVHDRHVTLTELRIAQIAAAAGPQLGDIRLVGSADDPRVQVADFLAGVARRTASHALAGRGDPALLALLRPHVDPQSVWADRRSWSEIRPDPV